MLTRVHLSLLLGVGLVLTLASCSTTSPSRTSPRGSTTTESSSVMQYRQKVVKDAQTYVGSPYKYAGRDPKTGFDCSGFTSFVLAKHGVDVSPASAAQSKEGRKVALDKVKPGDLMFFGNGSAIQHVGLVVRRESDNSIVCVHSSTSRGVIVENMTRSSYWNERILFARDVITGH